MTFEEFRSWCADRICDGLWYKEEADVCMMVCENVLSHSHFKRKREKYWKKYFVNEDCLALKTVSRINNRYGLVKGDR